MDIDAVLTEARKKPNTTVAIPVRRTKAGIEKFFSLFECQRCGNCCVSYFEEVEFTEPEFNAIKKHLPQGGRNKFKKVGKVYRTSATPCMFYSKKNKGCSIYESRPRRCRTYPTGYSVLGAPDNLATHTGCPSACKTIKECWNIAGLYGVRP